MRETTKHGPRLDEALERETRSLEQGAPNEARVEEGREQEAPADGERDADAQVWSALHGAADVRGDAARDPLSGGGR